MARWARLELATLGLENRCSVRLSYHRVPVTGPVIVSDETDKGKSPGWALAPLESVGGRKIGPIKCLQGSSRERNRDRSSS